MSRRLIIKKTVFPDLPTMMLSTLDALRTIGGSASIHELDEQVIEQEGITEEEQSFTMPNDSRQKVKYYLAWARTFLKRGGALDNSSRGVWSLSEKGESINDMAGVRAIHDQVNAEERERAKAKRSAKKKKISKTSIINDIEEVSNDGDSEDWQEQLHSVLLKMDPDAFERLAQRLLREAGFSKVEVRGKSGDGGIDGVGVLRVNLVSFQVYFQCKRWKNNVGSKEIRDFRGALQGRADKGLFITTGNFTSQASDEATRDGAIAIDLIDGERLCQLLKQFELGVVTKMVESVLVDAKWFGAV